MTAKFAVGDIVVLRGVKRRIAKVGTKYAYLEADSRNTPYCLETGKRSDPHSKQFGTASRIIPLAEWEESCRRQEAIDDLADFGLRPAYDAEFNRVYTNTLRRLVAVLKAEQCSP